MAEFASASKRQGTRSQPEKKEDDRKRPHSPTEEARRRSDGKLVVIVCDPEHYLLGRFVVHLLGHNAGFFGSPVPMFWVVEMRGNGHGTRRFLGP
jgi:hypothetical protein